MVKKTISQILKKADKKLAHNREIAFYRIDFPPPWEYFDINHVLAQEISPNLVIRLQKSLTEFLKVIGIAALLFLTFFFVFNAPAYYQIIKGSVLEATNLAQESYLEHHIEQETKPPEQELIVLSKDPIEQKQEFPELEINITPPDNRLIIPAIDKNIPIVEVFTENIATVDFTNLDDEILEALKSGVVHYPGTANPGEEGNAFITGHSSYYLWDGGQYKEVFALLPQLEIGDIVIVYYNQEKFTYEIFEKEEVSPSDVNVLNQPEDVSELTLMTCTPVGTNLKRLILKGELL